MQFVTSKSGMKMPALGLGTWQSDPGLVSRAVSVALSHGYRHIDCAFVYGNEAEVGEGIAAKIADGTVKREDLFVTSKLWNTYHRPELVKGICEESLKRLGLKYLDLYLMHSPMANVKSDNLFALDKDGFMVGDDVDYVDTYKAMEELVDAGLCKAIGLSNFNSKQLGRILENCRIPPANLQIESSPYLLNQQLIDFAHSHGVTVTGYSPLGSPARPWAKPDDPKLLEEPLLKQLGEKYKKTTAQILIRFQMDRGIAVIPKSVKEERIKENFDVLDFSLTKEEVASIAAFNKNFRSGDWSFVKNHKDYPFNEEF